MRCTQIVGLKKEAEEWINKNCKKENIPYMKCPHCSGIINTQKIKKSIYASAAHEGMFNDGPELHKYETLDGKEVIEIVQNVCWSSGPVIFLCLKTPEEMLFTWTKEEMRGC